MFKKAAKLSKLTGKEWLLFIEALILYLWVGLLLKVIPFRWIPRLFANAKGTGDRAQSEFIELIRNAIGRASGVSPWKNRCLVSSLAGRCMLRRRKIQSQVSLGVAKDAGGKMIAHAWLRVGEVDIVPMGGSFHELYHF